MKMQKRGAAMISFHWLLVIIAGGAIFVLFTLFINTGRQAAESSLSVDVLLHFDTIFSSLVTTEKTEATLPSRQDLQLDFTCGVTEDSVDSSFRLSKGVTKDLDNVILFSQSTVSGKSIFTIARNFAIPFSVSSLLYVTDPNVLYVIESAAPADRLKVRSLLPRNATVIEIGTSAVPFVTDIEFRDYRDIVVIAATKGTEQFTSFDALQTMTINKKTNVYVYHIKAENEDFLQGGTVRGYLVKSTRVGGELVDEGTVEYEGDELLAGILHSESIGWYECVKAKLNAKISRVAYILDARAQLLSKEYNETNRVCYITYNFVSSELQEVSANPKEYKSKEKIIEEYNEKLERQSCPLIY